MPSLGHGAMSFLAPWTHLYGYSLEPGVWIPVIVSGFLYWRGQRQVAWARRPGDREHLWRGLAFYAGLAATLVALESPIDYLSYYLFFMHMIQHCMLQMVVAPLLIIGAPWTPMWRGLPLRWRRAIAPIALRFFRKSPVRSFGGFFRRPQVGVAAMALTFWSWHIPTLYDLSLANQTLHDFEHLTMLLGGLVYWSLLVDSPPLRHRMTPWQMTAYIVCGATSMWMVAFPLGLSSHAWYAVYLHEVHRPLGISALTDQQWGAGVAWVPAGLPLEIMLDVVVYRWMKADEEQTEALSREFREANQAGAFDEGGGPSERMISP